MPRKKKKIGLAQGGLIRRKTSYYYRTIVEGKQVERSLKTQDEEEALERAADLARILEAKSKEHLAAEVNTLKGWAEKPKRIKLDEAWGKYEKDPKRAKPKTENIRARYKSYFRDFVKWASGKNITYLDEITDDHALEYADSLETDQLSADTHNKRVGRIARVFRTLAASGFTREETTQWKVDGLRKSIKKSRVRTTRRRNFKRSELEAIFAVLDDSKKQCKNKREIRVLFYLGVYTGQRMKDCVLLEWDQIDFDEKTIAFIQFKTGEEVEVPMAPQVIDILKEAETWRRDEPEDSKDFADYVLPELAARYQITNDKGKGEKNIGGDFVNKDVLRVIGWAGIKTTKHVKGRKRGVSVHGFHSLRHTFASNCLNWGVSRAVVVDLLGTDSDIIDAHYSHAGKKEKEAAIQLISEGKSLKDRYDEAIEFLDGLEQKSEDIQKLENILRGEKEAAE